jgi:hypothetical protein
MTFDDTLSRGQKLYGFMKWDGCIHVNIMEGHEQISFHLCDLDDFIEVLQVIRQHAEGLGFK